MAEGFKAYLLPGSLSLLLIFGSLGAIALALGGRWRHIGRWGLAVLFGLYWLMAIPIVAHALVWGLGHSYHPIRSPQEAAGSQAVVVLGGGAVTYQRGGDRLSTLSDASALRALEGSRLYRLLEPRWVVVSGGPSAPGAEPESSLLRGALVQLGIPADRILEESTSGNTYEQAVNLRQLLAEEGIQRFVLVTSQVHMPRAMGVFRHVGLDPTPSSAPEQSDSPGGRMRSVLPSLDSLGTSREAMREVLGLIYYGVRGWLSPATSARQTFVSGVPTGLG